MLKQLDTFQSTVLQDKRKDKSSTKNADSPKKPEAAVKPSMFTFNLLNVQINIVTQI